MLTQIIQVSESNTVEQNSHVLGQVALYFSQLTVFMLETDVEISTEVNQIATCNHFYLYI